MKKLLPIFLTLLMVFTKVVLEDWLISYYLEKQAWKSLFWWKNNKKIVEKCNFEVIFNTKK